MSLEELFKQHLQVQKDRLAHLLEEYHYPGVIITQGEPDFFYQDDQERPFRSSHHFAHYCPLKGSSSVLVFSQGQTPELFYYRPEDFWYDHEALGEPFWIHEFKVTTFNTKAAMWRALGSFRNYRLIGPPPSAACESRFQLEPVLPGFESRLFWYRSYKSEYEVHCLNEATIIAARGHKAAEESFMDGGSELDIHLAYLKAARQTDEDLPYHAIVCLNEKAAVLHYAQKRDHVRDGDVLLIDSGAKCYGYCSDITRTYAARNAPETFRSLLKSMDQMQRDLCTNVAAGQNFGDLHHKSHIELAKILLDHELIRDLDPEQAALQKITKTFYPHGVGHMLGLFVHDVGGRQKKPDGTPFDEDQKHPTLRTLRNIEKGHLFTVEPGLYFIPMLLDPLRSSPLKGHFNWKLIDELLPYGGIRIEDNIYIGTDGVQNLTRAALP